MARADVDGVSLSYDAVGTAGATVVWVTGPWAGRNPFSYLVAGYLMDTCRTIYYDSPNYGQSGFVFRDTPSEWHLSCEYVHGLCRSIGALPAFFAGPSGGGELALLMAHLYPHDVKGVVMYRPTDSQSSAEAEIIRARYSYLADVAETAQTMDAVVQASRTPPTQSRWSHESRWLADWADRYGDRVLQIEPRHFAAVMRTWGKWMGAGGFYRANLSDNELSSIETPVLIHAADDPFHPASLAQRLAAKLPACVTRSSHPRSEDEMYEAPEEEHPFGAALDLLPGMKQFILDHST